MAIMLIRSIIIYCIVLVIIRFMGKRQVGEMQPFELVITLIIADLACNPMSELSVPLLHGVIPILTLMVLHFFICFLSRKSLKFRYLISGKPAIVITPKGINYKELQKLNMTVDDLIEAMRGAQYFSIEDIAYAIIETNGNMCILPKSKATPVTREDLKISAEDSAMSVNIVIDGTLISENVKLAKLSQNFIDLCLKKAGLNSIKNILLLTIDNNGNCFLQSKKGDGYITFKYAKFQGGDAW